MIFDETICAPATPPVNSSLAIIRVSGPESLRAVNKIFNKHKSVKHRLATFGSIIENDNIIDDVILVYYKSPYSFTGEDMIEIFCHGNQFILHRIIKLLNGLGIRLAEPGEFSKRAFLNGKMDLTEAEAINQVIAARSDWEIDTAIKQMHGSLSEAVSKIKEEIIILKADIETGIDFIEENIEIISYAEALNIVASISDNIEELHNRCIVGKKISHGIDIAITGKPNVGKSSILNLILNEERAIVSEIPGTTRDMIRESVQINGVHINLIDTAGIDKPGDEIEKIGIELSRKNIETASILLFVIDATTGIKDQDKKILNLIKGKRVIFLLNKIDLAKKFDISSIEKIINAEVIKFSAKTGEGFKDLENTISTLLTEEFTTNENPFIADMRIIDLLEKSIKSVDDIKYLLKKSEPVEIIAFEIQSLIDIFSQITGEISPDDILDSIFSRFCIGK